jgi:hypothetical protein
MFSKKYEILTNCDDCPALDSQLNVDGSQPVGSQPVGSQPVRISVKRCKRSRGSWLKICKITAFLAALAITGLGVVLGSLPSVIHIKDRPKSGWIVDPGDPQSWFTPQTMIILGIVLAATALLLMMPQLVNQYCSGGNACGCENNPSEVRNNVR